MNRQGLLLGVLFVSLCGLAFAQSKVASITDFQPTTIALSGEGIVTVTGCGFRAYSSVVCVWDWRYYSPVHWIASDNTIYCQTPEFDKEDFDTLPHASLFSIFFDGDENISYDLGQFFLGPTIDSFTPYDGYVNGGETFHVIGSGFSDFSTFNITFDGVQCNSIQYVNDNEITCLVPPGEFNQNAAIDVYFDNHEHWYLHFNQVYHYGAILYGVNPVCGNYLGGTHVTILGVNLADPVLSYNAPPTGAIPEVHVIYNNGLQQTDGLNVNLDQSKDLITFDMPAIPDATFGDYVQFEVFFKGINTFVRVVPRDCGHYDCIAQGGDFGILPGFRLGPIVYNTGHLGNIDTHNVVNPWPVSGHLGGGDVITITGCGLNDYNITDISILYGGSELCNRGSGPGSSSDTLRFNLATGDRDTTKLVCTTAAQACAGAPSSITEEVQVEFRTGAYGNVLEPDASQDTISYTAGPWLDTSSITPTRGPWTGLDTVAVSGTNLFYSASNTASNPGWSVTVNFDYDYGSAGSGSLSSVQGTFVSDTKISFVTPNGLFDLDTDVTMDFSSGSCTNFPRNGESMNYHFGPVCTNISPGFGTLGGGSPVSLTGEGFLEANNLPADTDVHMCINRIVVTGDDDDCAYEPHSRTNFVVQDELITLVTPSWRQNVSTVVGGNRIWGDQSDIWVHFTQPGEDGIDFNRNQLRPGLDVAKIQCPGVYYFSQEVDSVATQKGHISGWESVNVNGRFFNDQALNSTKIVTLYENVAAPSTVQNNDTSLTTTTPVVNGFWSNTYSDVSVVFDTCNRTYTGVDISFGARINSISLQSQGGSEGSSMDVYGAKPQGGENVIISGSGFTNLPLEGMACLIDNTRVPFAVTNNNQIICQTPCRPFGTWAVVELQLGCTCDSPDGDWRTRIPASQKLVYSPRIDSISPTYGHTSGGESVTVTGFGFLGWDSIECFFGQYSDQQHVTAQSASTVVCTTPINRAEFNTDVSVVLLLDADDDDDDSGSGSGSGSGSSESSESSRLAMTSIVDDDECDANNDEDDGERPLGTNYPGITDWNMRVMSPVTYHYGPVCTGLTAGRCDLAGCSSAIGVLGSGFQDCQFQGEEGEVDGDYPWNDCIFDQYEIHYIDPETMEILAVATAPTSSTMGGSNTDSLLQFFSPASLDGGCGASPTIAIEFFSPATSTDPSTSYQTTIMCPDTLYYGPRISGQSSTYYDSSKKTSYGWQGDSVTITGAGFADSSLGSVSCWIGSSMGSVTASSDSSVTCVVPAGTWDSEEVISLSWSNGCSATAGKFHYGPVIRSVSPTRGDVEATPTITISGFAFDCCGINSWSCAMPSNANWTDDSVRIGNTVECSVPSNTYIDRQINNLGVVFGGSNFASESLTFTEQQTVLRYYYGPVLSGFSPDRTTLSGRDQYIYIHGEGLNDPYLIEVFCDFFDTTGNGINYIPFTPLEKTDRNDTTIRCPLLEYSHHCGAQDVLRPRWRRQNEEYNHEIGQNYWKTIPPVMPEVDADPFFSDAGSDEAVFLGTLNYGPAATSVCDLNTGGCGSNIPAMNPVGSNLNIRVTFTSLRDFVSSSPNMDVGDQMALCMFGDVASDNLSVINANPDDDDGGYIDCINPDYTVGMAGMAGELSIILVPKMNAGTTLVDAFHWLPTITGWSRNWGFIQGHDTITIYGEGFCNYDTVLCVFGNNVEAVQGDISSANEVTCFTPPHAPGYVTVSLIFCDSRSQCDCEYFGSHDMVTVPEQFTYIGISGITPHEGPICGGTTVTYQGYGFSEFDSIVCRSQNGPSYSANILGDQKFTCTTPDFSPRFDNTYVDCVSFTVTGIIAGGQRTIENPFKFEYGYPSVTHISPSSVDWNVINSTTVSVYGEYFVGTDNSVGTGFQCQYGDETPVTGTLATDPTTGETIVQCPIPSTLVVGSYDLEVKFDCAANEVFTTNHVPIEITQNPEIAGIRPSTGPEIGGIVVTIEGDDFNGGSFYLCSFGDLDNNNSYIVGGAYNSTTDRIECQMPAILEVDRNEYVDFGISVDGGAHWSKWRDNFLVEAIDAVDDEDCQ